MASEKNKWIDAVARLISLTQERKLLWRYSSMFNAYEAEYAGKTLQLTPGDPPRLALRDTENQATWDFPESATNEYLMEAVRYQLVGVGDFLDELLTKAV